MYLLFRRRTMQRALDFLIEFRISSGAAPKIVAKIKVSAPEPPLVLLRGTHRGAINMNSSKLVSIIVPAYNSQATIARAIDSIIAQTYKPYEVIVVDDASSDATAEIVSKYASSGVRLVRLMSRGGASVARNAGIENAHGELVAFLDADDEWLSHKLELQVSLLLSSPGMKLVSCRSDAISPEGNDLGDIYHGFIPVTGVDAWKTLLATNFITTPSVLTRRDDLLALGGFRSDLVIGEDQDMWIRLALLGAIGYVPETLVRVHVRNNSLSSRSFPNQLRYTMPMIEAHIANLAPRLSSAEKRRILGARLANLGRSAFACDEAGKGFWYTLRSILLGHKPVNGIFQIINSLPPILWLKTRIRSVLKKNR